MRSRLVPQPVADVIYITGINEHVNAIFEEVLEWQNYSQRGASFMGCQHRVC